MRTLHLEMSNSLRPIIKGFDVMPIFISSATCSRRVVFMYIYVYSYLCTLHLKTLKGHEHMCRGLFGLFLLLAQYNKIQFAKLVATLNLVSKGLCSACLILKHSKFNGTKIYHHPRCKCLGPC